MALSLSRLKKDFNPPPLFYLGLSLGLALLGQLFLVQQDRFEWLIYGCFFDLIAMFLFVRMARSDLNAKKPAAISASREWLALSIIFLEAIFFRFFKLGQIPFGLNSDTANSGWGALRILHEGWLPLINESQDQFHFPATPYYELAFWFHFFQPSQYHLLFYSGLLSLFSMAFIYWFFRQTAGAPLALLTLAFIAPMRWDFAIVRMAHLTGDIHLFMFGCLAFGYYALESSKKWAWLFSTLFLSVGFYAYASFKPFLLLLLLILIRETPSRLASIRRILPTFVICIGVFMFAAIPMCLHVLNSAGFGTPADHLSIFARARLNHDWIPLLENPFRTALMFNHRGGGWAPFNLPGHRILDDATGILLVLGFGLALSRWKERKYFYGLTGAVVMCLPATLSINPQHSARTFGAIPFVAFLAAVALVEIHQILAQSKRGFVRGSRWMLLALVLGWVTFQNGKTYFADMANFPDFEWANALKETEVANAIRTDEGQNDYYLTPYFYTNFTVRFLDYFQSKRTHLLPWPGGPWPPAPVLNRGAWFVLDRAQTGLLQFIQELYPGGKVRVFLDQAGVVQAYLYSAPKKDLGPGGRLAKKYRNAGQGLLGKYQAVTGPYTQVDPILNFALRSDFPVTVVPPFRVEWTGQLMVKNPGAYQFIILTTDTGRVVLDGKTVLSAGNQKSRRIHLRAGEHPLLVDYVKCQGGVARFHLLWKTPGDNRYQVVPALAFKTNFSVKGD